MKILRVTSDLYPHVIGGIGIHTHKMSEDQGQMGHAVTVLTSGFSDTKLCSSNSYRIEYFFGAVKILGNTISPELILKLFKNRYKYDIIHAHSHLFFSTNICALIRRIGSAPLVITNHGIMSASAPDWLNTIYLRTIGRWTLNSADMIICYTPEEKEKLVQNYFIPESRISVISNGVDTAKFSPSDKKIPTDPFIILWIGRFVTGKGVEYLIRAMDTLVKQSLNINLILVGDGPDVDRIKDIIEELKIQHRIKIIKNIPYDEMPEVYQNSHIFILPSLHEGVPRTILESMSCGIPVIISDFSHLKELTEGGGLMFPKKDAITLAKKIGYLYHNEDMRKKMGEHGRMKIIGSHSWGETVRMTLSLYQKMIDNRDNKP